MATAPDDVEVTTQSPTTTTEKFDLVKKYLHDWPPEVGVDVHDAATYGLVFLVLIGVLFTFCIVLDLDFFRRRLKLLRELKREKELESLLGISDKNKHVTPSVGHHRPLPGVSVKTSENAGASGHSNGRRFKGLTSPTVLPYHVVTSPPPYSKNIGKDFRAV